MNNMWIVISDVSKCEKRTSNNMTKMNKVEPNVQLRLKLFKNILESSNPKPKTTKQYSPS